MKRIPACLLLALLLASPFAALAADGGADAAAVVVAVPVVVVPVISADEVTGDTLRLVWTAIVRRDFWLVGSLSILVLVVAARKFGSIRWPWFKTPFAGKLLSAVGGTATAFVMALMAKQPPLDALLQAVMVAAGASGIFSWVTKSTPAK